MFSCVLILRIVSVVFESIYWGKLLVVAQLLYFQEWSLLSFRNLGLQRLYCTESGTGYVQPRCAALAHASLETHSPEKTL